jgi:hypothetical protein
VSARGVRGDDAFNVRADRDNGNAALPAAGVNGGRRKQPLFSGPV